MAPNIPENVLFEQANESTGEVASQRKQKRDQMEKKFTKAINID